MASKQELEALVRDQEVKIQDLEKALSQVPPSDLEAIQLRDRVILLEGTNQSIVAEITDLREKLLKRESQVRERDARIAEFTAKPAQILVPPVPEESGDLMTARDIAHEVGRRNIPEDASFRRL